MLNNVNKLRLCVVNMLKIINFLQQWIEYRGR